MSASRYRVSVKLHRDFLDVKGDEISIGITSRPLKGEANREMLRKIADHFGVPSSRVRLVSGARSRRKVVEVENDK